jgi:hypothetical protein
MGISDYSRSTNYIRTKDLAPIIQPVIDYLITNQPCQIDIHLKVKNLSSIPFNSVLPFFAYVGFWFYR